MWIKLERTDDDDDAGQCDGGDADPSSTTQAQAGEKILLLEEEEMEVGEVVEIAPDPALVPSPNRKRSLQPAQKVLQCTNCDFTSILSGTMRNHVKTHGRNLEHKCSRCNFSSSQKGQVVKHMKNQHIRPTPPITPSSQEDRAEDLQVNVSEELNQPMDDVERPMTNVADEQQPEELSHPKLPNKPSNETVDVISCRRCSFWSRSPENFHKHLFQCSSGVSCSACDFSGTRLDVLHHIRERAMDDGDNAHSASAVCDFTKFKIPDNKYADLRQNIGATPMQYGFVNNGIIRVAPDQIEEESVWDPMVFLPFNRNEQKLGETERNYEKEKDGLKIKIEDSLRQLSELEKNLATKNIEYNQMEKRVAELKENASNMDQMKVMGLHDKQKLITQNLSEAAVLKHQAEMAHSKKFEDVKILMVQQVKFNHNQEAGKILEEAERELDRMEQEVEQKYKNWTTIFTECGEVSRQLVKAQKKQAGNIEFLFFLNNSLEDLNTTVGNLKKQIAALQSSIQKLIQSRYYLNEAQLLAQLKDQSKEFGRKETEWIQGLRHQFSN